MAGPRLRPAPTVEVVDGLAPQWPTLAVGGPLFASPGWLRAMDGRLGGRVVTIVVRQGRQATLAAYASVQEAHRPGELYDLHDTLVYPGPELPLTALARQARLTLAAAGPPPQCWSPSLLLMLPGYECTPVGPRATDPDAVSALVRGAVRWAADAGIATVAALYTRPEATELAAALTEHDFVRLPLTPAWELSLPGSGFDDYLARLPHRRRREAARELRRLDRAGVRIEPVDVAEVFDDLVALRCQLVSRYRGARCDPAVERARLRHIVDEVAGGCPHVLLATAGRTAIGFALFAEHRAARTREWRREWRREWHCLAVGTDYDDHRSRLTYFATTYYRAAELAYQHGVTTIGYGLGAWQAKRARGCRPVPLTGWAHTTDAALAATLTASAAVTALDPDGLDPEESDPEESGPDGSAVDTGSASGLEPQ